MLRLNCTCLLTCIELNNIKRRHATHLRSRTKFSCNSEVLLCLFVPNEWSSKISVLISFEIKKKKVCFPGPDWYFVYDSLVFAHVNAVSGCCTSVWRVIFFISTADSSAPISRGVWAHVTDESARAAFDVTPFIDKNFVSRLNSEGTLRCSDEWTETAWMKQLSPLRTESTVLGNQKHKPSSRSFLLLINWREFGSRMTINNVWACLIGRIIEDVSLNEVTPMAVQRRRQRSASLFKKNHHFPPPSVWHL